MAFMAEHDPPEERNHKRHPSRERLMENVVETTQQAQDSVAGNTELVCSCFSAGPRFTLTASGSRTAM